MRSHPAVFALLIAGLLMLSGCLQTGEGDGPLADESDAEPTQSPADEALDRRDTPQDEASSDAQEDETDTKNNATEPDASGSQGEGCAASEPPQPPHPDDHEVDGREELQCPGQYTILEEGTGETWDVPEWSPGNWWLYEHTDYQGNCERIQETVVDDTGLHLGVPVYAVELQRHKGCSDDPNGAPTLQNRTQDSLMHITQGGFIRHDLVFPLKEGKRWAMVGNCEREDCTILEMDQVTKEEDHLHEGELFDVWYTEWTLERGGGNVTFKRWWSIEHNALLKEEMWLENLAAPVVVKKLVEHGL